MLTECPYPCSFNSLISPEHAYRVPLFLLLKLTDLPRACLPSAPIPAPSTHWSPQSMLTECPYSCSFNSLISPEHAYWVPLFLLLKLTDPPRACLLSAHVPAPSAHWSTQSMLTECPYPCSLSSLIPPEHAYRVPLSLLLKLTDPPQSMLTECPYPCSFSSLISPEHAYRMPLSLLLQLTDPPRTCLPSAPIPAPSTHWSPKSMLTECPCPCSFSSLISQEHDYRVPLSLHLKLTDPSRACLPNAPIPAPSAHWFPQSILTECPCPCSFSSLISTIIRRTSSQARFWMATSSSGSRLSTSASSVLWTFLAVCQGRGQSSWLNDWLKQVRPKGPKPQ